MPRTGFILAALGIASLLQARPCGGHELSFTVHRHSIPRANRELALGDLDADGKLDALMTGFGGRTADFSRGLGSGEFEHTGIFDLHAAGGLPAILDVDGDGFEDVVIGSTMSYRIVTIRWGDGSANVASFPETLIPVEEAVYSFTFRDYDNDGHLDFVATIGTEAILGPGKLMFFPGRPGRRFGPSQTILTGNWFTDHIDGDFNGDGAVDLVVADLLDATVTLLLGSSDGRFVPHGAPMPIEDARRVSSADMNRDGALDLIVTGYNQLYGKILLGNGGGDFTIAETFRVLFGLGDAWAVELNGDGHLDLAVLDCGRCDYKFGVVQFYLGSGDGRLQSIGYLEESLYPEEMVIADIDDDGVDDILVHGASDFGFYVLVNETYIATTPRSGTVNAGNRLITDVLYLNGEAGTGEDRRVEYDVLGSIELRMLRPPAMTAPDVAPFALYLWPGEPSADEARTLPFGIGLSAKPMPLSGGSTPPVIWNNAGRQAKLGVATHPSRPAPDVFLSRSRIRRVGVFYLQGLIFDPASRASVPASITNGIVGVPVFR